MAKLGIYASQKALDATGNNIANVNTPGYTRQRVDQYSLYMSGADRYSSGTGAMSVHIGHGAMVDGVSQLRDPYLDIRYRNEQSSVGAMDKKLDVLNQLASILDEVGDGTDGEGVLEAQFNNLMTQLQNLANPNIGTGRDVADTLVRSAAFAVTKTFNQYAERLETLRQTQEASFKNDVDRVNDILESIRDLNNSIRKSEIHGSDALEQKDERNNLIDELSQYVRISVTTEQEDLGDGWMVDKLVIRLAGNEPTPDNPSDPSTDQVYQGKTKGEEVNSKNSAVLVDGIYATQFHIQQVQDPNDSTKTINDPNYQMEIEPLKDMRGRTIDQSKWNVSEESQTIKLLDNTLYGSLQSAREMLSERGEFATQDQADIDKNALTKRGIPYYQKALDSLANQFAKLFNDSNIIVDSASGNLKTDNGKPLGMALFSNSGTANTTGKGSYQYDDQGNRLNDINGNPILDDTSVITAANISISEAWSSGKTQIVTTLDKTANEGASTANEKVAHLLSQLMNGKIEYKPQDVCPDETLKNGNTTYFTGSFQEQLMNTWEVMSSDSKTTYDMYNNYNTSLDELYVNRDAVSGVDLNDEAMNMMQYQKSYSAACRLLTTIDEMIDKLVNGTGRAGL